MTTRHFLSLLDLSPIELENLIERAIELKTMLADGRHHEPMRNRTLAMIFEKSSTRTRVSFETAAAQFGGHAIFLAPGDTQLGRGEPIADTARVLSTMVDAIMIRTSSHSRVEELARYASVPVINGLSDAFHPCQLLADVLTWTELRGNIRGATVAWIGDGNNVCNSWINAARQFGFRLRIATPPGYRPDEAILGGAAGSVSCSDDPMEAVEGADLVVTDVWASMGQEEEKEARKKTFADYRVSNAMMARADSGAIFMHCLPAYRGLEVDADVIDGPRSVVWQQAGNRLHAQKALLEFLLAAGT
jgi:ornithine carbamoyltransferase